MTTQNPEKPARTRKRQKHLPKWIPRRLARLLRWQIGLVSLLGLLALAIVAKPAYRMLESKRADVLLSKAESLGARGDKAEQARLLRVAFQMAPWKPEVVRAQAKYFATADPERALPYYGTLLREGNAIEPDLRALLDLSLAAGSVPGAKQALKFLPESPEFWRAEAEVQLAMLEGDWMSAVWSARKAADRYVNTPEEAKADLLLVDVLRKYPTGDIQTRIGYNREILFLLMKLFQRDDESGMEAVSILSTIESSPPPAWPSPVGVETIASRLFAHPLANFSAKLNAAELRLKRWGSDDPELQRWMDELTSPETSPADLRQVALWLIARKLPHALLTRLPWQRVASDPELAFLHLLALARTGAWFEVRTAAQQLPEDVMKKPVLLAIGALAIQSTDGEETAPAKLGGRRPESRLS